MTARLDEASLAGTQAVGYVTAVAATVALTHAAPWLALPGVVLDHLIILVIVGVALGWIGARAPASQVPATAVPSAEID